MNVPLTKPKACLGHGRGAMLASAKSIAFGVLNVVSEFVDYERKAKSNDQRLDLAWFGAGASIKEKALELVGHML